MTDPDFSSKQLLLDPFMDPEPNQYTGPKGHFRSSYSRVVPEPSPPPYEDEPGRHLPMQSTGSSTNTNPFRRKMVASQGQRDSLDSKMDGPVTDHGQLTPPSSTSPRQTKFPSTHRPSGSYHDRRPKSAVSPGTSGHSRIRSTSLNERYPGDQSHRPLDILRRESRRARRSPHLHKTHLPGPDLIDRLDLAGFQSYHHEGPYDAASMARNTSWESSPIAALKYGNAEALKATPREAIRDSVRKHRPLDGVAAVPSGGRDRFGRTYNYDEGTNLMVEAGYRRWPGVEYKDDDIKGKGEPSYSIDKALQEHKMKANDNDMLGMELTSRPRRHKSVNYASTNETQPDVHRSNSTSKNFGSGLRKRFGSLRRRKEVPSKD